MKSARFMPEPPRGFTGWSICWAKPPCKPAAQSPSPVGKGWDGGSALAGKLRPPTPPHRGGELFGSSLSKGFEMAAIHLPRTIRIGGGVLAELPEVLAQNGLSRPLIVTDAWIESSGLLERVQHLLSAAGIA
ncbi:iron-containing alcohol dehydrogenase, partial [Novosphingobium sp.]|uniref:iron-containing alcohol dehydrogenase n=1 Tax=Novosphingobium sp. TaxID=1874826 RepID=UPI00286CC1FC